MKTLLVLAVSAYAVAQLNLPACWDNRRDACVTRDVKDKDEWATRDYLVNGARMSVAVKDAAINWTCFGGDPTEDPAPKYGIQSSPNTVQLIDCSFSIHSFGELFDELTLDVSKIKELTVKSRPQNTQWPTKVELEKILTKNKEKWVAKEANALAVNFLDYLYLEGVPMTLDMLISLHNIKTLILNNTGLTNVMNMSEFTKLHRLELYEPMLVDAELLNTSTALQELVLHAPDAGLASMPFLQQATFKEVYMIGSIFGNCQNLEELTIEGGELDHIPEHWLAGCSALWKLTLTHLENLFYLPDDLLNKTINLRYLDLSHNSLTSLPEGLFSETKNLLDLKLNDNYLKSLPNNIFSGPTSFRMICVSNNPQELLRELQRLKLDQKFPLMNTNCDSWVD